MHAPGARPLLRPATARRRRTPTTSPPSPGDSPGGSDGGSDRAQHSPVARRAVGAVAKLLLGAGILCLLFTAYELWGTGLTEAGHQAALRAELRPLLPPRHRSAATRGSTPDPGPTPGPKRVSPSFARPVDPPAAGMPVGTIQIPSIGLDQVVVEGVTPTDLAMGPGHYPGTPLPGEAGNVAIAGHRTTYRHPFYRLTAVRPGQPIVLTTPQGVFTYIAGRASVVAPTDVGIIGPTTTPLLTLTTCNPRYSAATRLVLRAALARSVLFTPPAKTTTPRGAGAPSTPATPATNPYARLHVARPTEPGTLGAAAGAAIWAGVLVAIAACGRFASKFTRRWTFVSWPLRAMLVAAMLVALWLFFGRLTPLLPPSL